MQVQPKTEWESNQKTHNADGCQIVENPHVVTTPIVL